MYVTEDGEVLDLLIDLISAIEYEPLSLLTRYIYVGLAAAVIGGFLWLVDIPEGATSTAIGIGLVVLGAVLLAAAFYYRRSKLVVHMPRTSFTFTATSDDLLQMTTAIRRER